MELCTAFLFLFALVYDPVFLQSITLAISLWVLLLIAVLDAKTQRIPDVLTATALLFSLSYGVIAGHLSWLGMLLGPVWFGAQWALSRGRWVGSGDIGLALIMGAMLGSWQRVVVALFIAYVSGASVAGSLLLGKKATLSEHIAFGPFLAVGTLLALPLSDIILFRLGFG